jgi:hypothetical protein
LEAQLATLSSRELLAPVHNIFCECEQQRIFLLFLGVIGRSRQSEGQH